MVECLDGMCEALESNPSSSNNIVTGQVKASRSGLALGDWKPISHSTRGVVASHLAPMPHHTMPTLVQLLCGVPSI